MSPTDLERTERACAELADTGRPVTFTAIAARTGIARATLYRRPELRTIVEEHRARGQDARTLSGLAAEVDGLRAGLEAVAAKVRRHEETLRRLTAPQRRRKAS
jgi:Family of unknown function (DUF6262)